MLDPQERFLEIQRLENGRWADAGEHHGDVRVRAEPFDAVELDLALPWPR